MLMMRIIENFYSTKIHFSYILIMILSILLIIIQDIKPHSFTIDNSFHKALNTM